MFSFVSQDNSTLLTRSFIPSRHSEWNIKFEFGNNIPLKFNSRHKGKTLRYLFWISPLPDEKPLNCPHPLFVLCHPLAMRHRFTLICCQTALLVLLLLLLLFLLLRLREFGRGQKQERPPPSVSLNLFMFVHILIGSRASACRSYTEINWTWWRTMTGIQQRRRRRRGKRVAERFNRQEVCR